MQITKTICDSCANYHTNDTANDPLYEAELILKGYEAAPDLPKLELCTKCAEQLHKAFLYFDRRQYFSIRIDKMARPKKTS